MTASHPPFSISISPTKPDGRYKSLTNLKWDDIPKFAVLTGKNGSGKTQLLEVLAAGLLEIRYHSSIPIDVEMTVTGFTYKPADVVYISSDVGVLNGGASSVQDLLSARNSAVSSSRSSLTDMQQIRGMNPINRVREILREIGSVSDNDAAKSLQRYPYFGVDVIDVTSGLAHVFIAYKLARLEAIDLGRPERDVDGNPLPQAPWENINESLEGSSFPYRIVPPPAGSLTDPYILKLRDVTNNQIIQTMDLSSGEQTILRLILWLHIAANGKGFPKLILLDEPDAHLHPTMTRQFLDVVLDVLVEKHGTRVILTTHSPSTVAMAPEDSLFQIDRGARHVLPVSSRADAIALLTSGLVTVTPASKFCFVEDSDDVLFYDAVRDLLSIPEDKLKEPFLSLSPSVNFLSVSVGEGSEKLSGGESIVKKWIGKLDAEPLNRTFLGLIDRDKNNQPEQRLFVLGRYSFENYLLDPTVVFCLLSEEGRAPVVDGVKIPSGSEHLVRSLPDSSLQKIVDQICTDMERQTGISRTQNEVSVEVHYTSGQRINLPNWLFEKRGKDLLIAARKQFGELVTRDRLIKALKRCRMIPKELADTLRSIQTFS